MKKHLFEMSRAIWLAALLFASAPPLSFGAQTAASEHGQRGPILPVAPGRFVGVPAIKPADIPDAASKLDGRTPSNLAESIPPAAFAAGVSAQGVEAEKRALIFKSGDSIQNGNGTPEQNGASEGSEGAALQARAKFDGGSGPSISLASIMSELLSGNRTGTRQHPDEVSPWNIKSGDTLVVAREAFNHLPMIKKRLSRSVEMKVVEVRSRYHRAWLWKYQYYMVFLENRELGRVGIPILNLQQEIFSKPDFSARSAFQSGEYVRIGDGYGEKMEFPKQNKPGDSITFSGNAVPYLGRFVGIADEDHYVIETRAMDTKMNMHFRPAKLLVPRQQVYGLASGTAPVMQAALQKVLGMRQSFYPEEAVRYRDRYGMMQAGVFLRERKGVSKIRDARGQIAFAHSSSVFKTVGPFNPVTPMFNSHWIEAAFKKPYGLLADFLNGGAILTSHPDFARLTPPEQVKVLMRYVGRFLPWNKAAMAAEAAGLRTFNKLLAAGAGVCRHNSVLLATILSEAGYAARVVEHRPPNGNGHSWLEVDVPQADGSVETYVVDPTAWFIEPMWKVKRTAKEKPDSMEKEWYAQPGRRYVMPRES